MSWTGLVYIFAGLFGFFYVLPKAFWLIADAVHRYIHSGAPGPMPTEEQHLHKTQKAVVAFEAAATFKADAKPRQRERGGAVPEQKRNTSASSYRSEAKGQRGKATSANRQYVSEMKRIAEKMPELIPRILSGEVNMLRALKKPRFKQAG